MDVQEYTYIYTDIIWTSIEQEMSQSAITVTDRSDKYIIVDMSSENTFTHTEYPVNIC